MPLCLLAVPVFLSGTFLAAHAAVSILWRRNPPNTNISPLAFHFLILLFIVPLLPWLYFYSSSSFTFSTVLFDSPQREPRAFSMLVGRKLKAKVWRGTLHFISDCTLFRLNEPTPNTFPNQCFVKSMPSTKTMCFQLMRIFSAVKLPHGVPEIFPQWHMIYFDSYLWK